MPTPTVAVYAIAHNEAPFCSRFVASCAGADLIVVADTGSTDGTADVLRRMGVTVHPVAVRPWRFDSARNAALAMLPPSVDICVSLDLDEVLVEGWRHVLDQAWAPGITRVRYPYIWSWHEDGSPRDSWWADKIHARRGYRWLYPCHEALQYAEPGGEKVAEVPGLVIHHHPNYTKSRSQYLGLLELAVREYPASGRMAFAYGSELYLRTRWDAAREALDHYLRLPAANEPEERSQAMILLARCCRHSGEPDEALDWCRRAVAECPTRREVWCCLALEYCYRGDWELCYQACEAALKIQQRSPSPFAEADAWRGLPHDLAAVAASHLQRHAEAYAQGLHALRFDPADGRLRTNPQVFAARVPLSSAMAQDTHKSSKSSWGADRAGPLANAVRCYEVW
jgi:glycosyltransferase involved in cell wall biosynthesis